LITWIKKIIWNQLRSRLDGLIGEMVDAKLEEKLDSKLQIRKQLAEFEGSVEEDRGSYWMDKFDANELKDRFIASGMKVQEEKIDIDDFERWRKEFPEVGNYYKRMDNVFVEKVFEHYLTFKYLNIDKGEVLMDVGAADSPFPEILRKKGYGAYRQDLIFAPGVNGYNIGGDAGQMPVEDGFADVMTLHCSFECFQGGSDSGFAKEAGRVLKSGGRVGIVPLYVDTVHFIMTSPWCDKRDIEVDPEGRLLWRDDKYRVPFSRHYAPETLVSRVASRMKGLDVEIVFFTNLDELNSRYEGQKIYSSFMLRGVKP
jgi:hypothetical protein